MCLCEKKHLPVFTKYAAEEQQRLCLAPFVRHVLLIQYQCIIHVAIYAFKISKTFPLFDVCHDDILYDCTNVCSPLLTRTRCIYIVGSQIQNLL